MTWRKIRYYLYIATTIIGVIAVCGLSIWSQCRKLPDAALQIGVYSEGFVEPTSAAMDMLNRAAGCRFLVPGKDVLVKSDDAEPCGSLELHEPGHSATAYRCRDGWEVLIALPGDIHTQTCIVLHELGHVAGLEDKPGIGIMNQYTCPTPIRISDSERARLAERFCQ